METPEQWPDPEEADPEQFAESLRIVRDTLSLLGAMQNEMALAITQDPRSKDLNEKWRNASEQRMMDFLDTTVKNFVGALPVATVNRVNLFASVMSCHTSLTGDPLVRKLIERLNEEVMSNQD